MYFTLSARTSIRKQRFYGRLHSFSSCCAFWYLLLRFFFQAAGYSLSWQHSPLKGHVQFEEHCWRPCIGDREEQHKDLVITKEKRWALGREATPLNPVHLSLGRCCLWFKWTITASVSAGHCQLFSWWFGYHIGHLRKWPGFVLGPVKGGRKLRLLLGHFMALGNRGMPRKRGGLHEATICSNFT